MLDLVTYIVEQLVDDKQAVNVTSAMDNETEVITIRVAENDVGKVIGKQGKIAMSIRTLAKELHVSIITTKRAYEELEALGLVDTVVGKGTFVSAAPTSQVREAAIVRLEEKIADIIKQAKIIGLTKEELKDLFLTLYEEE